MTKTEYLGRTAEIEDDLRLIFNDGDELMRKSTATKQVVVPLDDDRRIKIIRIAGKSGYILEIENRATGRTETLPWFNVSKKGDVVFSKDGRNSKREDLDDAELAIMKISFYVGALAANTEKSR